MQTRCERAVREVFPVARALIAKKLMEVYGLSQTAAAKKMGMTQPAMSQYKKNLRGSKGSPLCESQQFVSIANDTAKGLAQGSISAENLGAELCRFCRLAEGKC
jgi:predicted transcriptional regulator